jgi:hypothetical protein
MKKAMAITAFKRPAYLCQVLESVKKNDISDYTLFIGVEPVSAEVIKICRDIDFVPTNMVVNPKILGVKENPFATIKRAFDWGADVVWQLEDDVVVSPDATKLIDSYLSLEDKNKYLCLNLYNPDSTGEDGVVISKMGFNALSFVATKSQWDNYFAPNYHVDKRGWDWSMTAFQTAQNLPNLTPTLSRSYHIGREGGTHYRPAMHDSMYIHNKWNQSGICEAFAYKL